jgi:hypothetical protein
LTPSPAVATYGADEKAYVRILSKFSGEGFVPTLRRTAGL